MRAELALVAEACAHEQVNPRECPLYEIRDRSLKAKTKWLDAVSDEAIHNIHTSCRLCLKKKELNCMRLRDHAGKYVSRQLHTYKLLAFVEVQRRRPSCAIETIAPAI